MAYTSNRGALPRSKKIHIAIVVFTMQVQPEDQQEDMVTTASVVVQDNEGEMNNGPEDEEQVEEIVAEDISSSNEEEEDPTIMDQEHQAIDQEDVTRSVAVQDNEVEMNDDPDNEAVDNEEQVEEDTTMTDDANDNNQEEEQELPITAERFRASLFDLCKASQDPVSLEKVQTIFAQVASAGLDALELLELTNSNNMRPLEVAVQCAKGAASLAVVRYLVEQHATNALALIPNQHCVLHFASMNVNKDIECILDYLVALLPDCVRHVGFHGDLPLHSACASTASTAAQYLVSAYPLGLRRCNDMGTSPLGYLYDDDDDDGDSMALLQALLMPAYTELKDEGFVESTTSAMLDDETMVQEENTLERLQQDAWPPVHFCCIHGLPVWQLEYALQLDPQAMITPAGTDHLLPFHCVCAALREWSSNGGANDSVIMQLLHIHPGALSTPTVHGELPLHFALRSRVQLHSDGLLWQSLVDAYPRALMVPDKTSFYPLQLACIYGQQSLDTLFCLSRAYPDAFGVMLSSGDGEKMEVNMMVG
jgi:hypothetical protein